MGQSWTETLSWNSGGLLRTRTLFFKQLSRLLLLEEVDLNGDKLLHYVDLKEHTSPRWRLDSGLGLLSTLTKLKTLVIYGRTQFDNTQEGRVHEHGADVRSEEVALRHWPLLETLSGMLSVDDDTQESLVELVRNRGITFRQRTK